MSLVESVTSIIAWFGFCAGLVCFLAAALWIFAALVERVNISRQRRSDASQLNRVLAELNYLDRWLSYDFPIVEDLKDYLEARLTDRPDLLVSRDVSAFREDLRRKYGQRKPPAEML